LVEGRITTEQHGERVTKVLAAKYIAELEDLTADIPPADRLPARVEAMLGDISVRTENPSSPAPRQ
jgi:Domain of unknown function (DUF1707)